MNELMDNEGIISTVSSYQASHYFVLHHAAREVGQEEEEEDRSEVVVKKSIISQITNTRIDDGDGNIGRRRYDTHQNIHQRENEILRIRVTR